MSTESDGASPHLFEEDIQLARRMAVVAHRVVITLKVMDLPNDFDEDLASLSTDLGDLWAAQHAFNSQLETLFSSNGDWEAVADSLVDLRSSMDHMAWHLKSVRRPIGRINRFAYRMAEENGPAGQD